MIISEAWRMFRRNVYVKLNGLEKFTGMDSEICTNIVKLCYNSEKGYFQVSPGEKSNYPEFYARDFGWCCESLINLGYKKEVINTLEYALNIYQKNDSITVAINPFGQPFNFPNVHSPDSVTYMFRSLRIIKNKDLIIRYAKFLNNEAKRFRNICIDDLGVVRKKHFSGMRDYAIVKRSCYDMIMACMLDDEIKKINNFMKTKIISNPFDGLDLKKKLIKKFWNGKYFEDYKNAVYGHTNIYPYFLGVIKDKKMMQSSLKAIHEAKLDNPIPLKYESKNDYSKYIWNEIFVSGWEKHTSWTMLGMAYIDVLSRIDKKKAREYLKEYKKLIEKNGFVEVYDGSSYNKLKPYNSLFYTSETRMLWAAMYLDLKKRLENDIKY